MGSSPKSVQRRQSKAAVVDERGEGALPTMKQVASAAGVSLATVSNVINGRSGAVSERTRRVVLREIKRLGYRPQTAGRGLRTARRHALAMLIVDEAESYLADPFVANVVAGFTEALNARGYLAVLHGSRQQEFEDTVVVRQFGVDGYCLMLSGDRRSRTGLVERLVALKQPVVLIQETETFADADLCVVRQDDFNGGQQIADHLLARGVKDVAVVLPRLEWPALVARLEGLKAGIRRAGRSIPVAVIRAENEGFASVTAAVEAYLGRARSPSAMVGGNDQIAIAAMQALRRRGMVVPRDVLVTGFNAFEVWQYTSPTITTVVSPAREIGSRAAHSMIDRLESGRFASAEIVLPVVLQPGEST